MSDPPADLVHRLNRAARSGAVFMDEPEEMASHAALALELAQHFAGRPDEFETFATSRGIEVDVELDEWLVNLPGNLENAGMAEEAVRIADALASTDPRYESDHACAAAGILARSGQVQEAKARVDANLERFRDDPFTLLLLGETLEELGDLEGAIRVIQNAVDVAEEHDDPTESSDVYDYANEFFHRHPDLPNPLRAPRTRVRITEGPDESAVARITTTLTDLSPRPARNAPCPCGSGRKFKRCCGGVA